MFRRHTRVGRTSGSGFHFYRIDQITPIHRRYDEEDSAVQFARGRVMTHDVNSLPEPQRDAHFEQQRRAAKTRDAYYQIAPNIEMVIGSWHLDKFGNQTREITACDQRG
jgi:hypothetical protein